MAHLFVDELTVIDCSILHSRRGLIGASWLVDLELTGELDDQGMLLDFGLLKPRIKRHIDDAVDHKLLVPKRYTDTRLGGAGDVLDLDFTDLEGRRFRHRSPAAAVALIDCLEIDADSLTRHLTKILQIQLPANVTGLTLRLSKEPGDDAFFRYSHGLKKHDGNCQRVAHGHRSRLRIWLDGERDTTLEREWAGRWRDIYIGTREDLAGAEDDDPLRFEYDAAQGRFDLELPRERVYLIDSDSTIECIARHIADAIGDERPGASGEVRVWEGVRKGAVATFG